MVSFISSILHFFLFYRENGRIELTEIMMGNINTRTGSEIIFQNFTYMSPSTHLVMK